MKIIRPQAITDLGAFTRASAATYVGMDGLIHSAAVNEPRFQWDAETGDFEGLLIESAASNSLLYSADASNATVWAFSNCTVDANAMAAPDGAIAAGKIKETAAAGVHGIAANTPVTVTTGATICLSAYVKAGERSVAAMWLDNGSGTGNTVEFDLVALTTTVKRTHAYFTGLQSGIDAAGAGWRRIWISATVANPAVTAVQTRIYLGNGGGAYDGFATPTYTGTSGYGLYAWGMQTEFSASPSSYIPTTSAVVNRSADSDSAIMVSSVAEDTRAAWSAATTYAVGDDVHLASSHRWYRSLQAGNLNKDPLTQTTWWQDRGATNRWAAFDTTVGNQTANAESICYGLNLTDRADSVVLLNISAATVSVVMTDATDGVVYAQEVSLIELSGLTDWYSWYFEPVQRKTELALTDLPPYVSARVDICIADPGATPAMGEIILGLSRELGGTQYGARLGILDYSAKQADTFGNYTILERAYSRRQSCTFWCENTALDQIYALLSTYRATPIVYLGTDENTAAILYGFYKDFSIDLAYFSMSICSIELEGLT